MVVPRPLTWVPLSSPSWVVLRLPMKVVAVAPSWVLVRPESWAEVSDVAWAAVNSLMLVPSDPTWEVHTFEGISLDRSINLVQATLTSDNTVYAQLAADLGESSITAMAHKMGVTAEAHLESIEAFCAWWIEKMKGT